MLFTSKVDNPSKSSTPEASSLESDKPGGDDSTYDSVFEKKTMRYIDWHIIPFLALVSSMVDIDRINIGAAYTAGMGVDLKLQTGNRYSILSSLDSVPYILFALPGVFAMRKVGVRNWLTFVITASGAVQLATAFVPTWGCLVLARILLGIFGASILPTIFFIIPTWYTRHEVQKRMACFILVPITISALGPILAYTFTMLDGQRGIKGWAWIFIIEGSLTLFSGVLCWFFVPDFPHRNKFLTPEQTAFVLKRVEEDRGDSLPDPITKQKVLKHLCDWHIWAYGIMSACISLPAYAQAYFISIILRGMGMSKTQSLLLSAPPYFCSIVFMVFFSWASDKTQHRTGFIVLSALICIVGLLTTAFASNNRVRYLGIFFTVCGNLGTVPGILAYASNNLVSHSKRAVQSGLKLGGVGAVIGTLAFRTQDAPRFLPGLATAIGSQCLLILVLCITTLHLRHLNRLSKAGKLAEPLEGQVGFFYTL